MQLSENNCLTFKIPTEADRRQRTKKSTLSSKEYLNLIKLGIELSPNIEKTREYSMKNAPKVKFRIK